MYLIVVAENKIDGINMWPNLQNGSESPRTEFIYNLDNKIPPLTGHHAIRYVHVHVHLLYLFV